MSEEQIVKVHDIVRVKAVKIANAPWNPREMPADEMQNLAENLEDFGLLENVVLVKIDEVWDEMTVTEQEAVQRDRDDNGEIEYLVVSGNQRSNVVNLLDPDTEVNSVILTGEELDRLKFLTVRMNVIKGKFDPVKFATLVAQMEGKYNKETVRRMMLFADRNAFSSLIGDVKKELPKELADKLDESQDQLKTVDDLALVLNTLFTQHGDTLPYGFMAFTWGGKVSYMIKMGGKLKARMSSIADHCTATEVHIDDFMEEVIVAGLREVKP